MSEIPTNGTDELPDDNLHRHLYVWLTTSETACAGCGVIPDLEFAKENTRPGEQGAVDFAIRAAEHLKLLGWQTTDGFLWCPACAAKHVPES